MTAVVLSLESALPLASVSANLAIMALPVHTPLLNLPFSLLKLLPESISSAPTSHLCLITKFLLTLLF